MSRHRIAPRLRFFVGCEGPSEQSYVAVLDRLLEERGIRIHLDRIVIRGGDPAEIIDTSVEFKLRLERQRGAYQGGAILLDSDTRDQCHDRLGAAIAKAERAGLLIVWQQPCHEAMLLRHLPGLHMRQPGTSRLAFEQLRAERPSYEKALPAMRLIRVLDIGVEAVRQAAGVEPELRVFLEMIGFPL